MAGSGVADDGSWQPAFCGQREPFTVGHTVSMRHGARSARVIEPLAGELLDGYLAERGDLSWAMGTLESLARIEARALLLDKYIAEEGMFDGKGEFRARLVQEWRYLERQAGSLRHSLGWTPRARAAMMRDESLAVVPWATDAQRDRVASQQVAAWLGGNPPESDGIPDDESSSDE